MKTKLIAILALLIISFSTNAFAAFEVTPSLSSNTLTENQQATVSVQVKNIGSSQENNIIVQLSGSWFSVISECPTISSLQASQTRTVSCIIKPTSTGTGLSLSANAEAGSSIGSGSISGISVLSQSSSLIATITSSSSVTPGSTFYVGVTVTAPSSTDATNVRATISASGACSIDTSSVPAEQNIGTVSKGTSKSPTSWKVVASSSTGTCSLLVNVVSDNAGIASPSKSVSVATGGGGTGGTGGGAAGGTGGVGGLGGIIGGFGSANINVSTSRGRVVISIPSIQAGSSAVASITKTEDMALSKIEISVKNAVSNVKITASKLSAKPSNIVAEPSGNVYHYIEIQKENIEDKDISSVKIDFMVEKTWIINSNINASTIALQRYAEEKWNKLSTTKTGEDDNYVYYQALSPGLSVFAITGEKVVTPTEEKPTTVAPPISSSDIVIILIVFIILGLLFILYKKRKTSSSSSKK